MTIRRNDRAQSAANPDWFIGNVTMRPVVAPDGNSALSANEVRFSARARTKWHTLPARQTLLITEGTGWVQRKGEPRIEVRFGDVVRFAPAEKHWHGATAEAPMTRIVMQEARVGSAIIRAAVVSSADYAG